MQEFEKIMWKVLKVRNERCKLLELALAATLAKYEGLAGSSDCGYWDCETEPHVIEARKLLATTGRKV